MKIKKSKIAEFCARFLTLIAAAFIMAVAMQSFILPYGFAPGGVNGLASLLQAATGFPAGYSMFLLNAPLLASSFFLIKKTFTADTLFYIFFSSLFTELLARADFFQYTESALIASVTGGLLEGLAIGMLLLIGASSGGTDIIGLLIQKKFTGASIARILFVVNAATVAVAGFTYVFALKMSAAEVVGKVFFSLAALFTSSRTMEAVMGGFSDSVKFEVVTQKPRQLANALIYRLHRGVTLVESVGAYSERPNCVLVCVVRKRQTTAFKKVLRAVDPDAFAYSEKTREVLGNGFNKN